MVIRTARDEDFATIAEITNHYITTTTIHFGYEPVTADELREQAWDTRFPWLVVEEGDVVLGYAKAGTWRARAAYQWTAELGLYIAPDARRKGHGRALYAELIAECKRRGFRSLVAGITLPNDPSIALHETLGFEAVGTFRDAGYKNGTWCDVGWWQLRLFTDEHGPRDAEELTALGAPLPPS